MARDEYVVHNDTEIAGIRLAAQATASVRDRITELARPGMSTKDLDDLAGSLIASTGGTSAFLGYRGFPAQICISLNEEVVHGIGRPDLILQEGDVISVDIGVKLNGYIGDTAKSFVLGNCRDKKVEELLENTEKSLMEGVNAARAGNYIRDISAAVQKVAKKHGYGIVREYVGHGCGVKLHEPPEIPNFVCNYRGPRLVPGMVLAIEPMLNLGTHRVATDPDRWTVRTLDAKVSAHFEHMVLVTETEPEILTWQKK
jgi:methionyl aminopeptidase